MNKRLIIIHPTIAPYRIDFFNKLSHTFDTRIILQYENLKSQTFDYQIISNQFDFKPLYLSKKSKCFQGYTIWKQIKDFRPDIVVACEYGLFTMVAFLTRFFCREKYKLVVITDDSYDMVCNGNDFSAKHRFARKLIAPHIDDFVVVNPNVEQWYRDKYGRGIFFPIIIDETKAVVNYDRLLHISHKSAMQYGLLKQRVLLSVSRLVDLKNLHGVIEAFAQSKTDSTLVIIGDGPERAALQRHASKVNKGIIFMGRLEGDSLLAWYNIASVFILASYKEAFGAVTNEALLAGCRVIISNKAGSSCLVNKWNGETVDPNDVKNMADAIDRQFALATVPDLQEARRSMMPVTFDDLMGNLISRLKD